MFLTGIKPTGTFHLGNYMSIINPVNKLLEKYNERLFLLSRFTCINNSTN